MHIFFLLSIVPLLVRCGSGWDYIKDFFGGGTDTSQEAEEPPTEDSLHSAKYRCPPNSLDYLTSDPRHIQYADRPERCGCPEGMQKCTIADWYVCINRIGSDGKPQKCPK